MRRRRVKPIRVCSVVEKIEARVLLSSTPFTADGQPWEVTPGGTSWVEAENYDYGGEGVAYHDTTAANQGGAYRTAEGVDLEGPSAGAGGTYNLAYTVAGEWARYTVKVDVAGTYTLNLRASDAGGAATDHVTFTNGSNLVSTGAIAVASTGGWQTYVDHTATVALSAGTQTMTLYDDAAAANVDYLSLTPAGATNASYNPTNPGNTSPAFRDVPTLLPSFGAVTVPAEYFDTGGAAAAGTGVQAGGYYWPNRGGNTATYPYTSTPFRPTDTIDLEDDNYGLVVNHWYGGNWAQYTIDSATNVPPTDPAAAAAAYQTVSPTLTDELLITYANSGTAAANFVISDTTTNPTTGAASLTQLATVSLPTTGGGYTTIATTITLPRSGLNTLRVIDADAAGANSHVNLDTLKLINATTSGNNGLPWDVATTGTTALIPADDVDIAPGSATYAAGTNPTVGPTADADGGNDVRNLTVGDATTYTISADATGRYTLAIRAQNAGTTPATVQVNFDGGAAFGGTVDPITFAFTIPVGAGYQTVTTSTNVTAFPNTTYPYVELQAGVQKMRVSVLAGTVNYHWAELAKITTTPTSSPDASQSGTYAATPPDAAYAEDSDLLDRVYNTKYYWINPPANATLPTNDWWTNILVSRFTGDLWTYPQKLNDSPAGVAVSGYSGVGTNANGNSIIPTGQQSVLVGGVGTTFADDAVLDYGDWTVHYRIETATPGTSVDVTTGRGLPYTWFEFNNVQPTLTLHTGSDANQNADAVYDGSGNPLAGSFTADHFRVDSGGEQIGVFAPAGTTFTRGGGTFTVTFAPGVAHYLVTAVLPDATTATLNTFYTHAYAVPRQVGATPSSKYTWSYSPTAGTVTTNWNLNLVPIDPANPPASLTTIQGWLPLDYADGATGPAMLTNAAGKPLVYPSINGNIEVAVGNAFSVAQTSAGLNFDLALPQLIGAPTSAYGSTDYSPQQMLAYVHTYVQQNTDAAASAAAGQTLLQYGADTYFGAKPLQEMAEFALMTKQIGDVADYNIFVNSLTRGLTDWFTYTPGEGSHYFAYYPPSHALIGFHSAYGSENYVDNHFHYGYFTAAAGVLAMLNPAWAAQYGSMAKMVAMQYANWVHPGDAPDVNTADATSLPFLRTFEPWVGHSYAGGTSSPGGNNQESSSEAIQSWLGIVLLGQALNDPAMTAAGMMGYTVESKAVREQWFNQAPDAPDPNALGFPASYNNGTGTVLSNVAIDFDGGKSYATYFGANPEYILGIEALPIWPDLDFLGQNAAAARQATASMLAQRVTYFNNPADNTFASFESGGENDWLNIALGYQSQYDPQSTAAEYARMIAQQTPTAAAGTTGLYYFQDHSDQTYGLRDYGYHLSLPLGGVYTHGADATTMSNTRSYMAYNPGTTAVTVTVYDASDNPVDTFTAAPGFNVVTRSTTGGHAPPVIITGAAASPATVTGTTAQLSVLATDERQVESNLTYTWALASGPAAVTFSADGTNGAKATTATFAAAGTYTFAVTATDVTGLTATTSVTVVVQQTLASLTLSPATASVFQNGTQQFTAAGYDQFGILVTNPAVTWSATGGTISNTGLFRAPGSTGSATVTATTGSTTASAAVAVVTQLPAPTAVVATTKSPAEIDLTWAAPSGTVTGYYVYRGTTPGGESATPLNATPVTTTSYKDTTVAAYTSYFYTVKAVNTGGASLASNEASATTATDLALNKPAFSSALENNTLGAALAVDGSNSTRWGSAFADPSYLYVNLGGVYAISEIKLNWEAAAGQNYLLQTSTDAVYWTTVATVVGNTTAGWHDYPNLNASGQFVQMLGQTRDSPYGYSLFDFNVYGPPTAAPLALTGSNYLALDPAVAGQLDVWSAATNAGLPTRTIPLSQVTTITDTATSTSDTLTVDFARGNPLPGGATFAGLGGDRLVVKGDAAGDAYHVSPNGVTVNGVAIAISNVAGVSIQTGGCTDAVAIDVGSVPVTLVAPAAAGVPADVFSSLSIGAGDAVTFASAAGSRAVLVANALTLAGSTGNWLATLDLGRNDLIVQGNGTFPAVADQLAHGAITSSAAAADATHLTTLGGIANDDGTGQPLYTAATPFDGRAPGVGADLVRYTLFGDANLDGVVDGRDYVRLDAGYATGLTGWSNGDFNHDGRVDGSDYTLIDNAFNLQPRLTPSVAIPTSEVAVPSRPTGAAISSATVAAADGDAEWNRRRRHRQLA